MAYWVCKERLYIFVTRGATPRPMGRELYLTWTDILYFKLTVLTEWDFQVVSSGWAVCSACERGSKYLAAK